MKLTIVYFNTNSRPKSTSKRKETCVVLTCHIEKGRAFVTAVLIGCLAGVFTTILFGWAQKFQTRSAEATDNPVFLTLLDGVSIFEPLEAHIWSILSFTFKLGIDTNVDLRRDNSVLEHRLHCIFGKKE